MTVLPSGASLTCDDPEHDSIRGRGAYLHDPDDAGIRPGLVAAVAADVDGWFIDPKIAFVSSADHVPTPFARAFRIIEELPYREKSLKAPLIALDIRTLTVKNHGVKVVPEALIRKLKLKGSMTATIIMTRVCDEGRVFLVEPLPALAPFRGHGSAF